MILIINKIISYIVLNKKIAIIFFSSIIVSCMYFIVWPFLLSTQIFIAFERIFIDTVGFTTQLTGKLFEIDVKYKIETGQISHYNKYQNILFPFYSLKLFFSLLPLLLIVYERVFKNIWVVFTISFFFIIRSALIALVYLLFKNEKHIVLLVLLDNYRVLPFLFLIIYIKNNSVLLFDFYSIINNKFEDNSSFSIFKTILFLVIFSPLARVVLTYINVDVLNWITSLILNISKFNMSIFNYETQIVDSTIFIDNYYIHLGHGCIGLGLMSIIFILVICLKGSMLKKIIFTSLFIPFMLILNSLRINLLLIYYKYKWNTFILEDNMHSYSNYLIYTFVFFSFIFLVFYISDNSNNKSINSVKKK